GGRAEPGVAGRQLIQGEQAVAVGRAALAQVLGVPPQSITVESESLLKLPPEIPGEAAAISQHPLAMAQSAAIEEVKAREKALDRSYYPRFNLEGTTYARGTGIQATGMTGAAASGLGPNIQNWGFGV